MDNAPLSIDHPDDIDLYEEQREYDRNGGDMPTLEEIEQAMKDWTNYGYVFNKDGEPTEPDAPDSPLFIAGMI